MQDQASLGNGIQLEKEVFIVILVQIMEPIIRCVAFSLESLPLRRRLPTPEAAATRDASL